MRGALNTEHLGGEHFEVAWKSKGMPSVEESYITSLRFILPVMACSCGMLIRRMAEVHVL
jgi:hypothetical protein